MNDAALNVRGAGERQDRRNRLAQRHQRGIGGRPPAIADPGPLTRRHRQRLAMWCSRVCVLRVGLDRIELSACDPLNLTGVLFSGPRVPAIGTQRVVYRDGVPENMETEARLTS